MGILDEAIREHLELKRQHGADDSELKQLEDQAFGQADRPGVEEAIPDPGEGTSDGEAAAIADPAAEAPTEFMLQPDLEDGSGPDEEDAPPPPRREPAAGVSDIQEPPPFEEPDAAAPEALEPEAEAPDAEEPDAAAEEPEPAAEDPDPAEQTAAEHEAIPPPAAGHTTEERHAIADQPTEMYDVEGDFGPTDAPAPPDEELVAEEAGEARLGPAEPVPPAPVADGHDDEDDFFDEQRLSEELDQALEAPADPEPPSEEHEVSVEAESPRTEEHAVPHTDEHEAPRPAAGEQEEDVLEETPDFLEEKPEDDQLWFEQKPPKDFDFDD